MSKPSSKKKVSKKASGSGSLLTQGLAAAAAGLLLNQHAHAEDVKQSVEQGQEPALADEQLTAESESAQVSQAEGELVAEGQDITAGDAEIIANASVEELTAGLNLPGAQLLEEVSLNGLQLAQLETAATTTAAGATTATAATAAAAEATAVAGGAAAATAAAAPTLSALSIAGLAAAGIGVAAAAGGGSSGGAAPAPAPTPSPTQPPTSAPTQAPTQAPTPAPTATPTQAPTPAPTQTPTPAPTPAPTETPTPAPTPAPTASPTPAPTASPTPAPTASPTPAPTSSPAPSPGPGPSPAPTPTVTNTGKVVDGNVEGAKVFYDANNNGVYDTGEASGVTLANGTYTLSPFTATANGRIVVEAGGIDTLTGQKIGMMFTGVGMNGVNPLAMLLAASPGVGAADMLANLGLTGLDLNNYDPMADMLDPAKAAAAQKAFTVSQQVFAAVQAAAAFAAKVGGGAVNMADIAKVAKAVADTVSSGGSMEDAVGAAVTAALNGSTDPAMIALAGKLTTAINTVNAAIETSYANLAAALQSGDPDAIAKAVAAAAMSQNALLSAANGDTSALDALSDADALAELAELYEMAVDKSTFTVDFAKVEQLAAKNLHFHKDANVTVNQLTAAHLAGVLALEGLNDFGIDHLDSNEATVSIDDTDAAALIDAGIDFVAGDLVEMTAEHTELQTSFKDLQGLGVDSVILGSGLHGLHVTLGDGADLSIDGPVFASGANVVLKVNADQLDDVLANTVKLGHSHIDQIDVQSTGLLQITEENAAALIDAGISFAADDAVNLTVDGTHVSASLSDLQDLGVDTIKAASGVTGLHIGLGDSADFAAGLPVFDDNENVTLKVGGSQLSSVLAHTGALASSNIDHIDVDGAGIASITAMQAESMLSAGIDFAANDTINLIAIGTHFDPDVTLGALQDLGVDTVTGVSKLTIGLGGVDFAAAAPRFANGSDVTLKVGGSQLSSVLAHTSMLANSNIDHIDVDGAGIANITAAQAENMLSAGINFAANDNVSLTVDGTSIGFTNDQLSQLGVDTVIHNGVAMALESEGAMFSASVETAGQSLQAFSFAADLSSDETLSGDADVQSNKVVADEGTVAADTSLNTEQANASAESAQAVEGTSDATVSMSDLQMAALLVNSQAISEDNAEVTIHAAGAEGSDVASLAVSLADLANAGVDHVESDGNVNEIIVDLGIELTDDSSANDELHQLLTQFTNGEPLFAEGDNVHVKLGENFDVNVVDETVLAELKLLGIDDVLGGDLDHDGNPDSKPTM